MDSVPPLTDELRIGRRALEGLGGLRMLGDFEWNTEAAVWALRAEIEIDESPSPFISDTTEWYVVVEREYPLGEIAFMPAKTAGITATFPHQRFNGLGATTVPWRAGKICLETPFANTTRMGADRSEPRTPAERLCWHADRAILWVRNASRGTLLREGDPFELPDYSSSLPVIGFQEDLDSLAVWAGQEVQSGTSELARLPGSPNALVVTTFSDLNGSVVFRPSWGSFINSAEVAQCAVWLRVPNVVALRPWAAPASWGELRAHLAEQGIDFEAVLGRTAPRLRDGRAHPLLIGFPISDTVGAPPVRLHWIAAHIPALSRRGTRGVRANEHSLLSRDRAYVLGSGVKLGWLRTENWADVDQGARGFLDAALRSRRVLLLGAGALGSMVAELLIRGGLRHLTICDGQDLQMGNLVRHTLDSRDIGSNKAKALAHRLSRISPNARVYAALDSFPNVRTEDHGAVASANLIVDCTANDDVLSYVERFPWTAGPFVTSLSVGRRAKRLYCYFSPLDQFRSAQFISSLAPWLALEARETPDASFRWEAPGCWNPAFPARVDEVSLLASIAVGTLERALRSVSAPTLRVFQRTVDSDGLPSVHAIAELPDVESS